MRKGWTGLALALAAASAACGGSEDAVIESYFAALEAGDQRKLEGFAAVTLEEKVTAWERVGSAEDSRLPVTLPELAERYRQSKAALDAHRAEASRYSMDRLSDVNTVSELMKEDKPIPARLQEVAETWKALSEKEAELKAAADEALAALEKEKRLTTISAGEADDLTTAQGEILVKRVDLNLTIDGQPKPYSMTLRRYMLEKGDTPREISRWIVYDIQPKG